MPVITLYVFALPSKTCVSYAHSKAGILYSNLILGVGVNLCFFLVHDFVGNFLAEEDPSSKTSIQMSTNKIQVIGKRVVLGLLNLQCNIYGINRETLSNNLDM
jgi:hypothetical protein